MGVVFGIIREEMPEYKMHGSVGGLQCREYSPSWVAKVSSDDYPDATTEKKFRSEAFWTLAGYIGAVSEPKNQSTKTSDKEAIAMTAPVVMTNSEKIAMTAPVVMTSSEKIAMTAPVVMTSSEAIAMTAPVVMTDASQMAGKTMSFILPSKYLKNQEQPPKPMDARVKIERIPGRIALVTTFSGFSGPEKAKDMASNLIDHVRTAYPGIKFVLDEATQSPKWEYFGYNPPFTLPCFRTNEVALYISEVPPANVLTN